VNDFAIRYAEPGDAEQLSDLLGELGYPNTPEFAGEKITSITKSKSDILLVAEVEGSIIGVVHLHIAHMLHEKGKLGRIMALVVTDRQRFHGVGKKLMETAEAMAKEAGCSKMEVTSAMHRENAGKFYEGLGYAEKRRRFIKLLARKQ
jgi:N-acetylglutamate synthase-like GNAT family acetyltransferase